MRKNVFKMDQKLEQGCWLFLSFLVYKSDLVFLNGMAQHPKSDYIIEGGRLVFSKDLREGDVIMVATDLK